MTDTRLRELERVWLESRDPEDGVRYYEALARAEPRSGCPTCGHAETLLALNDEFNPEPIGSQVMRLDYGACARCGLVSASDPIQDALGILREFIKRQKAVEAPDHTVLDAWGAAGGPYWMEPMETFPTDPMSSPPDHGIGTTAIVLDEDDGTVAVWTVGGWQRIQISQGGIQAGRGLRLGSVAPVTLVEPTEEERRSY